MSSLPSPLKSATSTSRGCCMDGNAPFPSSLRVTSVIPVPAALGRNMRMGVRCTMGGPLPVRRIRSRRPSPCKSAESVKNTLPTGDPTGMLGSLASPLGPVTNVMLGAAPADAVNSMSINAVPAANASTSDKHACSTSKVLASRNFVLKRIAAL